MIIKNKKIFFSEDQQIMKEHLQQVLEYELWDDFIEYLNHCMNLKNIKEPYDEIPVDNPNSKKQFIKDTSPYHNSFNTGMNRIINYNRLFKPNVYQALERLDLPTIQEIHVLSFWISSYAYEFFFVQMPRFELTGKAGDDAIPDFQKTPTLNSISNIYDSFSSLKKGFSLLFAPFALAIINDDFGNEELNNFTLTRESSVIWLRQLASEGYQSPFKTLYAFSELTPEEQNLFYSSETSNKIHNEFPYLNTLFVILFSDLAEKILLNNEYDFSKNTQKLNFENSLMKFLLVDFMPEVIDSISKLLNDKITSGIGADLYFQFSRSCNSINVIKLDEVLGSSELNDVTNLEINDAHIPLKKEKQLMSIVKLFNNNSKEWIVWFNDQLYNAKKFNEWCLLRNDPNYFDIMKNVKTVDDLLNNTFDDRRKNHTN